MPRRVIEPLPPAGKAPQSGGISAPPRTPLPAGYGVDRIVLQTRDPWWLHTYWELRVETVQNGRRSLGADGGSAYLALRLHELGGGSQERSISPDALDWYLEVKPDGGWFVEIGLKSPDGRFLPLAQSNTVRTPPAGPSDRIDEKWGYLKGFGPVRLESSSFMHPAW